MGEEAPVVVIILFTLSFGPRQETNPMRDGAPDQRENRGCMALPTVCSLVLTAVAEPP